MTPESIHRSASSPVSASARRAPRIAIALGVVALLAAVALIARGSAEDSDKPGAHQAATPGSQSADPAHSNAAGHTGQGGPEQDRPEPPQFNGTLCWEDLERFNDTVTLETFREWAAPLLAVKDPLVREYLKGRLAELIGDDEGRASEVLGWAREAPPAEFKLLMAGLRGSQVLPKVAAQLTSLGLDESLDLGRRAGFLDELQRLPQLEPATLEKLAHFAKDATSGEAGWVAARAIGRVMKEDFTRTGNAKPYLDKLLTIGAESLDEQVRYLALEMEMHAGAPLDTQATARLAKILATEGSDEVRQVVAHDLSFAQDKKQALDIYAKAFATEKDLCVRWALFRFAARAAGKDALPVMAEMALTDPRFQGNYQDFERLYASGIVDFNRIWFSLPTDDPHGCLHRHE
ncbi:hypothetical protein [Archangium sp.]|uniref:hypothetical protein n=1 Tax=Archangium sp. TaxID=1872627 RepID=UPI002D69D0AF|nr:hypothetical protein [Archangium sp.]HYO58936.1 hypothetical protein [Archangium sp.]